MNNWTWFIARIISISQNICFEVIQNGSKSNRVLDQRSAIKFLVAEKCKPYKMCNVYSEACCSHKMFIDRLSIDLPR